MFPHRWCSPPLRNAARRATRPPDVREAVLAWLGGVRRGEARESPSSTGNPPLVQETNPPLRPQPPPPPPLQRVRAVAPPAGMSLICGRRRGEGDA